MRPRCSVRNLPVYSLRHYSRARKRLESSDEARRQLTMGHELDPANPIAPTVPILEELFADSDLYGSSPEFLTATKYPFVTPSSPWAESVSEIKGCSSHAVSAMFTQRLLTKCGTKSSVDGLASMYYFPPWHAIAQARKSRPSLAVLRGPGAQFNGNPAALEELRAAQKSSKSMNPFDYAVWRLRTTRRYRRALWDLHTTDGLYVVTMRKVPTPTEAHNAVERFVEVVKNADLQWAERQTVDLTALDEKLARSHMMPLPRHLNKSEWKLTRPRV